MKFSVERVTYSYRFQSPLLGGLELDLIAYTLLVSYFAYYENDRRYRSFHLIIASASISALLISQFLNLNSLAYIALGLASIISTLIYVRERKRAILPGILVSIMLTELAALVALSSYYIIGRWLPPLFHVVMRERHIWAPLEWVSILLLIIVMWNSLASIILGRNFLKSFKSEKTEASREEGESKYTLALAIFITVLLIVLPHLPPINPEFKSVSVDTLRYKNYLENIGSGGLSQALRRLPDRPVFVLILYYAWLNTGQNIVFVLDLIFPLVALILLTVASFYTGKELYGKRVAGYAALLVPLGYAIPVFIAGGFQANSFALTTAVLVFTIKPESRADFVKLTTLFTLTGLIHPWTFLMYGAAMIAYNIRDKRRFLNSLSAVTIGYIISHIIDYSLSYIHISGTTAEPIIENFGIYLFGNWFNAVQLQLWNTLSNPIYLSMSILNVDAWIASIMGVAAPLTLILPAGLLVRLFLNIPLQIHVSKTLADLQFKYKVIIMLIFLVRVIGNLSGLTPMEVLMT